MKHGVSAPTIGLLVSLVALPAVIALVRFWSRPEKEDLLPDPVRTRRGMITLLPSRPGLMPVPVG